MLSQPTQILAKEEPRMQNLINKLNDLGWAGLAWSELTKSEKGAMRRLMKKGEAVRVDLDDGSQLCRSASATEPVAQAPKRAKRARKEPMPEGGWPRAEGATLHTCTKCGESKPADAYYTDRSRRNGLDCWCKACGKTHYAAKRAEAKAKALAAEAGAPASVERDAAVAVLGTVGDAVARK
jgi:hypothetical protein